MDIIQHGVHSVVIMDLVYKTYFGKSLLIINPWVALLFFAIGILPDLSGWLDGKIRGTAYRWDGAYKWFHEMKISQFKTIVMLFTLPGLVFHIMMDKLFHKPEGGWIDNGTRWNLLGWVITLIVIYFIYFN